MKTFPQVLQDKNYANATLQSARLRQLKVNASQSAWIFVVELKEVVPYKDLITFMDDINAEYLNQAAGVDVIKYEFNYINADLTTYYQDYYDSLLNLMVISQPSLSQLKRYKVEFKDNTYYITKPIDASINENLAKLTARFKHLGLNVEFKVINDESLSIAQKINEKNNNTPDVVIVSKPKVVQKEQHRFSNQTKALSTPISKIPHSQYEIDKYLNENGTLQFIVEGEILSIESRDTKASKLYTITIFDRHDAITLKKFSNNPKDQEVLDKLKAGQIINVSGRAQMDTYGSNPQVVIMMSTLNKQEEKAKVLRKDSAKNKRIEFHTHTQMSAMDGITSAQDYLENLESWGHEAVAFTDHNGVYAFPDIFSAAKGKKIKPIYGVEMDYCDERQFRFTTTPEGFDANLKNATYVSFDIETTSLSATTGKIIEIGAVKFRGQEIIETFQSFVNPHEPLLAFTKKLTGITDEEVANASNIEEVLPSFLKFIEGCILVAQNADFDRDFIEEKMRQLNLGDQHFPVIDTLNLGRYFYHDQIKRFDLKSLARLFNVSLLNHHRASEDAKATAEIYMLMALDLAQKGVVNYLDINALIDQKMAYKFMMPKHITLLAQNQTGLKNIYKIVSHSLTTNFHERPRLSHATLAKHREGVLMGSACANGSVFENAMNKPLSNLQKAIAEFDYIEVQPYYSYLASVIELPNREQLVKEAIKKIITQAQAQSKLVIASSNAHYLNLEDKHLRDIYIYTPSIGGGRHPLQTPLKEHKFTPQQYVHTTNEMKKAFDFLEDDDLVEQIVVTNTHILNDQIEKITPFSKELYSFNDDYFKDKLGIASISEKVREMVYTKAKRMYGEDLPTLVTQRIEKELHAIISNGFGPIYFISHLLVKKSLDDGYLVGSRGSVGSSLVATLLDITEVNPLAPHYYCPNGDFSVFKQPQDSDYTPNQQEFINILKVSQSGYDLPDFKCPVCSANLKKDGQDIPFETFLGFNGDKVPDIDLNFSGDFQAIAHNYVKELIGEDASFRGGTVSTVANKTAFGYVKAFLEGNGITVRDAQVNRIASKIEGVRRTTGKHPGGIIIVPPHKEIYDVTPIQYPSDDPTDDWFTTHFDHKSFEDNLIKLDILGHDDPTIMWHLMEHVKKNPDKYPFSKATQIPVDDPKVYELFSQTTCIGIENDDLYGAVGSVAVPELGTNFVRRMLTVIKPKTFAGLVKVQGLSHGKDVWENNSFDLISGKKPEFAKVEFDQVIGCRDDIMVQLIEYGLPASKAFEIMEFVRKGLPSSNSSKWNEFIAILREHQVPEWYIWSCGKIKYMFPKAHACAYALSAMRIGWFKIYDPIAFYSTYFTVRPSNFDYEVMIAGTNAIRNKLMSLKELGFKATAKESALIDVLTVAYEMTKRGFKFLPLDINKSEATQFVIEDNNLRMPFVCIDGLGQAVADETIEQRKQHPFTSKKDVINRSKINKTLITKLEGYGVFDNFEEETQNDLLTVGLFAD